MEWDGTNTYYMKFYKYVRENPMLPLRHEIILESENVYLLLKTEQLLLDESWQCVSIQKIHEKQTNTHNDLP